MCVRRGLSCGGGTVALWRLSSATVSQQDSVSCVNERRISGDWGTAVNLSSTCSLDSGAWCEVSSTRYPIDHIYYIRPSASLFWQLIAPGKERERKNRLFIWEREECFLAWAVSLHFSLLRVYRGRSVTDVGSEAPSETTTTAEWYSKYGSGKFLDVLTSRKKINIIVPWNSQLCGTVGFAAEVCGEYWRSNLCFYSFDWFGFNNTKPKRFEFGMFI